MTTSKNLRNPKLIIVAIAMLGLFQSCKKDGPDVDPTPPPTDKIQGMYILSEGNWGSSNASLSYYDFQTEIFTNNVFKTANPQIVMGLGDVGNDIGIYGSKMYLAINNSNKVEVVDAKTVKSLKTITVNQCRFIAFYKNNVYITSNDGYVAVVDTATLSLVTKINVGNNPEQLAVVGDKLYVANSGAYSAPNYEKTLSVIDLNTNQEINRIDVAINLRNVAADSGGDLYVTSLGDYGAIPNRLYVIDTKTGLIKKKFDIGATNIWINGNFAYLYYYDWNTYSSTYVSINTLTDEIASNNYLGSGSAAILAPYGIGINNLNGDIFIADAKDYLSPGTVSCFSNKGELKWSKTAGAIPSRFAFLHSK